MFRSMLNRHRASDGRQIPQSCCNVNIYIAPIQGIYSKVLFVLAHMMLNVNINKHVESIFKTKHVKHHSHTFTNTW